MTVALAKRRRSGVMNAYRHNLRDRRVSVESFREKRMTSSTPYTPATGSSFFEGSLLFGY
jgi:hypothetical protein